MTGAGASKRRRAPTVLAAAVALAAVLGASPAGAGNPMLQNIMKRLNRFVGNGELDQAAAMLQFVSAVAPDEYPEWGPIADRAKAAAQAGDIVGVKASCNRCHDQYRARYKTKYGSGARDPKGPVPIDE